MTEPIALSLPALPRYSGVPRRYEETRPVLIQDFSHRRILGLGHGIHQKLLEQAEEERVLAVHTTENSIRAEAQTFHEQAIQNAQYKAQQEQEKIIRKLQKEQEQAIKKEALRVEMAMQKSALEMVRQEREDAGNKLTVILAETEARLARSKEEAVKAARDEERFTAAQEASRAAREHADVLDQTKEEAKRKLQETTDKLTLAREKAVTEAIKKTQKEEQQKYAEDLAAAIVSYDIELAKLRIEMDIQLNEINRLLVKIEEKDKSKERLNEEIQKTRRSFQDYITRVGKFTEGHAGFMIKPLSESVLKLTEAQ